MTVEGELIRTANKDNFTSSLLVDDRILKAGKYVVLVSPVWNDFAQQHEDYKKVFVEILCSESIKISHLQSNDGFKVFALALTNHALSQPAENRK